MKPENKLGKIRVEPDEAFDKLKAVARKILSVSKDKALKKRAR